MLMNQDDASNYAQALVHAASERSAHRAARNLQARFDAELTDLQAVVRRLGQGPPIDAPIELRIYGPSLTRLQELGADIERRLKSIPEVLHTRAMLDGGEAKVWVALDEDEARLAGLTLNEISAQLESNLEGQLGGSVLEDTESLPVRIRFGNGDRSELGSVGSVNLIAPDGEGWIPVSALGGLSVRPAMSSISRRDGERTNTIKAYTQSDALPQEVTKALLAQLEEAGFAMPPAREILGRNAKGGSCVGLAFPYFWPDKDELLGRRIRLDRPDVEHDDNGELRERQRYFAQPCLQGRLYVPHGVGPEMLSDPSLDIVLTVGETSALALWGLARHEREASESACFLPVGLQHPWGWRGTTDVAHDRNGQSRRVIGPIEDLGRIEWQGRRVVVVFDSDASTDKKIDLARQGLAKDLRKRGAEVFNEQRGAASCTSVLVGLWDSGVDLELNLCFISWLGGSH